MQEPDPAAGLPLRYDGLLVAVGGGRVDATVLHELAAAHGHLVGADGGGDAIAAAGLLPEAIIGDLDSLRDAADWDKRTRLVLVTEQETTDFEKLLYSTEAPVTVALGMTGGRFDHTLAAIDAVTRHAHNRHIILVDESDLALALTQPFAFAVGAGERVSVHPLGQVRFVGSSGLVYPLEGLTLAPGLRTGTSNAATSGSFAIEPMPEQAPWLLILDRRHLMPLVEALLSPRG